MEHLYIPKDYQSELSLYDTQVAIKTVKDFFQQSLAEQLYLLRVSAPLFVTPESGLNDNLNGVERPVTFGIKERKDCLSWVNYVCETFGSDTPIFLSGVSMGAAAVLMASSLDLPQNVLGIIADSPYSSPAAIIEKVCRDRGYPTSVMLPVIRLGARCFGHFDLDEATVIDAVRRTRIPILLIHGEDDRFVPCRMSQEIWSACGGPRTLKTFPGAGHGLSYMVDTKRYERLVRQFVEECMQRQRLKNS